MTKCAVNVGQKFKWNTSGSSSDRLEGKPCSDVPYLIQTSTKMAPNAITGRPGMYFSFQTFLAFWNGKGEWHWNTSLCLLFVSARHCIIHPHLPELFWFILGRHKKKAPSSSCLRAGVWQCPFLCQEELADGSGGRMRLRLDVCCIQGDSANRAERARASGLGSTQPHYLLHLLPSCRTMRAWGMRLCTGTPGHSCGLLLTRAGLSTARSANTLAPSHQRLWYAALIRLA